jgi:hypothetical protein
MNVENWLSVPLKRANTASLTSVVCAMAFLIVYEPKDLEQIEFMRASAVLLVGLHAAFHVGTVNALKFMALLQVADAEHALESYRDPRRVSHLDLAATWLGFYSLTPYIADL